MLFLKKTHTQTQTLNTNSNHISYNINTKIQVHCKDIQRESRHQTESDIDANAQYIFVQNYNNIIS